MTIHNPIKILSAVTGSDGAEVQAIRDTSIRRYAVICTQHGRAFSFYYTPAHTDADHKKFNDDIALAASEHAADEHDTPTADSTRGLS